MAVRFDEILGNIRANDSLDSYTKEQIDEFLSKRVRKVSDFATYTPEYNGEIVQYIGETDNNYTKGLFYQVTITESTYGINTERSRDNINSRVKLDINSFNNAFHERYGESVAIYAEYNHTQPTGWKDVNRQILIQVADPNVQRYDSITKFDQSICEIFTDAEAFRNAYGANIQFASSGDGGGSGSGFVIEILSEPTTTWNAIKVQKTQIADVDGLEEKIEKCQPLTFELLSRKSNEPYVYKNHDVIGSEHYTHFYPYATIPHNQEVSDEGQPCRNYETYFQELLIKCNLTNQELREKAPNIWCALSHKKRFAHVSKEENLLTKRAKRYALMFDQKHIRVPYVKYACWFCSNNNYYYYTKVTSNDNPTEVDLNAYVYWNPEDPQLRANLANIQMIDETFNNLLDYGITLEDFHRQEENDLTAYLYEWYSSSTQTYLYTHGNTEEYNPNNNEYLYYDAEDIMSQLHDNFCNYEHFGFRDKAASKNDYEYTGNIIHQFTLPVAYAFKDSEDHYVYFTESQFDYYHPEAYYYAYMLNYAERYSDPKNILRGKATTLNCLCKMTNIGDDGYDTIVDWCDEYGFTYSPEDNIYEYVNQENGHCKRIPLMDVEDPKTVSNYADVFPIRPFRLSDCKVMAQSQEFDFNEMTDETWDSIGEQPIYFKVPYDSYYILMREIIRWNTNADINNDDYKRNCFAIPSLCGYKWEDNSNKQEHYHHLRKKNGKVNISYSLNLYEDEPLVHKNNCTTCIPVKFKVTFCKNIDQNNKRYYSTSFSLI